MTDISTPQRDRYKRPFDLTIIAMALVLMFPVFITLWVVITITIWFEDRGTIFYKQCRLGKNSEPFSLIKFRTMITDAESVTGPVWSSRNDPRITRVGRVLRRFRLDEIPQIVNILRGEMSLVGPRPERPELVDTFTSQIANFGDRLRVHPGVAGLAQVQGNYSTSPRNKLRYDNLYISTLSPALDLKLLLLSLWVVLRGSSGVSKDQS